MMQHKTITLDEKTALLASRMPNFSAWVRQKLIDHARSAELQTMGMAVTHIAPETARVWGDNKDKCNPKHKKGMCATCWGDA